MANEPVPLFLGRMGGFDNGVAVYYPSGARVAVTPEEYFYQPWASRYSALSDYTVTNLLKERIQAPNADREQPEGIPICLTSSGWTLYAFWDRSTADKRFGNASAFLIHGEHSEAAAEAIARQHFPLIFMRVDLHLGRSEEGETLRNWIRGKLDSATIAHLRAIAVILGLK